MTEPMTEADFETILKPYFCEAVERARQDHPNLDAYLAHMTDSEMLHVNFAITRRSVR